jgi:hypothetical protein
VRTITLGLLLAAHAWSAPRPSPSLSPGEVIRIVIEALRKKNFPAPNAGIFTAYRFASPANHADVGPYGRFLRIVKAPDSAPLLSGRAATFEAVSVRGNRAEETVRIPVDGGPPASYRFILTRQSDGECRGCWMVDGVIRLP